MQLRYNLLEINFEWKTDRFLFGQFSSQNVTNVAFLSIVGI